MESTDLSITVSVALSLHKDAQLIVSSSLGFSHEEEHFPVESSLISGRRLIDELLVFVASLRLVENDVRRVCALDDDFNELLSEDDNKGRFGSRGRVQGRRGGTGEVGILVTPSSSTVDERSSGRSLHPNNRQSRKHF